MRKSSRSSDSESPDGPDDLDLWKIVTKDIKPLATSSRKITPGKARTRQTLQASTQSVVQALSQVKPATGFAKPASHRAAPNPDSSSQLDRDLARRLAAGDLPIDSRLDLHGLTQDEALKRLLSVIKNASKARSRMVLVITGKGRSGEGVLRRSLRHWLDLPELAPHILAVRNAQPKHGGDGAFYVLLRRIRD